MLRVYLSDPLRAIRNGPRKGGPRRWTWDNNQLPGCGSGSGSEPGLIAPLLGTDDRRHSATVIIVRIGANDSLSARQSHTSSPVSVSASNNALAIA